MESNAYLSLLPWVRQGAAAAIEVEDDLGNGSKTQSPPAKSPVASIAIELKLNGDPVEGISAVQLRGPGDVVGIDTNQVIRTDPRPGANDFEYDCFPSVEFDRPDFPWLFTPAKANGGERLRPWLCLVVIRKQAGVTLTSPADAPLPKLTIGHPAVPAAELPDLKESWAWAHAQAAAAPKAETATRQDILRDALMGPPELSLSRLVCPRILAPETDYLACVVPAFDAGRKAGLGLPIAPEDLSTLAPAWAFPPAATLELPVYYHWEFRSGRKETFEFLARRLVESLEPGRAVLPEGLGKRPIDIGDPGFPVTGPTADGGANREKLLVHLEGALMPIGTASADTVPAAFKEQLADLVNGVPASPEADPVLAPPIYGRWHVKTPSVSPTGTAWLDELNLDPRWRVVAALGTRVVQERQEALMASAWEQAGDLAAANQRLRQLQLSMAAGEVLHARHFARLGEDRMLRVAAPAFARLYAGGGSAAPALLAGTELSPRTLLDEQADSFLPVGANQAAMRRIGRLRGPLTRRAAAQGPVARIPPRSDTDTWVNRLNLSGAAPGAFVLPGPPMKFCALPSPLPTQDLGPAPAASYFGAFFVAPEFVPVRTQGTPVRLNTTEVPGFFRKAAIDHLSRFFPPRATSREVPRGVFTAVAATVLEQTRPTRTLPALARAILATGDNVLAPTAPGVAPAGVETIMAAPYFPQPMYEPLRDLSQDLLLPGLDQVKPDTVLALKTNRRFVEAYLVGLNHEMARELLWRGYPTDQRGTYFDRFWGLGGAAAPPDITALHTWAIPNPATGTPRTLGDASFQAPPLAEQFVLLLRSSLLQRYPNAAIYLKPALSGGSGPDLQAPEVQPLFTGALPPDVSFFGFSVPAEAATGQNGGPGYYVVIQEHPTEPRFGLNVALPPETAGHLGLGATPPANSAALAKRTRRQPVLIAIHASRLIKPA